MDGDDLLIITALGAEFYKNCSKRAGLKSRCKVYVIMQHARSGTNASRNTVQ